MGEQEKRRKEERKEGNKERKKGVIYPPYFLEIYNLVQLMISKAGTVKNAHERFAGRANAKFLHIGCRHIKEYLWRPPAHCFWFSLFF